MDTSKKTNLKSVIYVLIAGIMWGVIGLFVRTITSAGLSSMCIVFVRSIGGTILMGGFLFFYDKKLFKINPRDIWCFVGTGIVSLTFFNICYFTTITMTSLSVAAILLYTAPSIVMILSLIIFKEKINTKKVISVILAFLGCMLVTGVLTDNNAISKIGILIGLGSGLGYALYSIFARFALNKGYHSFTVTFYTLAFSCLGSVFFCEWKKAGDYIIENPLRILFLLLFGLISTVLPYIFYTLGLSGMESGNASIIASIEPVTATIIGVVVYKEKMSIMGLIGAMLVIASIVIVNININKKNEN